MVEMKDVNKSHCHLLLKHDIKTLEDSYPDNEFMNKHLKRLLNQFKAAKNNSSDNVKYWQNEYPNLKKQWVMCTQY
jgi:hypothetical protein